MINLPTCSILATALSVAVSLTGFITASRAQSTSRERSANQPAVEANQGDKGVKQVKGLTLASLFDKQRVYEVRITVADEDWDTLRHQSSNFFTAFQAKRKIAPIPSPYTYVKARVEIDGVVFPEVGIRKKGFVGSLSSTRPSLKVKLNFVDKKRQIEGLTNLTLNNNLQDMSLVSQVMGYSLFNQIGSPAPRTGFARVSVNGKSLGVYTHVETVRQPLFRKHFGNADGVLYEGTVVDFVDGWEGSFEREFGDAKAGRKKIIQLIDVLNSNLTDEEMERAIGNVVDLDAFYRYWAIEGLLGFWDGYSGNYNNYFIYLDPAAQKFNFVPWGGDSLFQKYSKIDKDRNAPLSVKTKGLIAHKLYQSKAGRQRYARTLNEILKKHWREDDLLEETTRIESLVKPFMSDDQKYGYRRALASVRNFIRNRRGDLTPEISGEMPIWTKAPAPPLIIGSF